MTRTQWLLSVAGLLFIALGIFNPYSLDAKPVAGQPQFREVLGWKSGDNGGSAQPCSRLTFVANDGGVGYAESGEKEAQDAGIPIIRVGERYRVISVGDKGGNVFIQRGSAATTEGGSIYVVADQPEEMSFSPRNVAKSTIYGRCSSATTCAVDLCPLYTPSLGQ